MLQIHSPFFVFNLSICTSFSYTCFKHVEASKPRKNGMELRSAFWENLRCWFTYAFFIKAFTFATPLEKSHNGVILELEPTVDGPLKGE